MFTDQKIPIIMSKMVQIVHMYSNQAANRVTDTSELLDFFSVNKQTHVTIGALRNWLQSNKHIQGSVYFLLKLVNLGIHQVAGCIAYLYSTFHQVHSTY